MAEGARPDDSGSRGARDKPLPPAAKKKRPPAVSGADGDAVNRRYTAPIPSARKGPSPRWVPVAMFGLWGVGLLLIILNYMELLPGSENGGNGWYLVGGLGAILAGIVTATQYR